MRWVHFTLQYWYNSSSHTSRECIRGGKRAEIKWNLIEFWGFSGVKFSSDLSIVGEGGSKLSLSHIHDDDDDDEKVQKNEEIWEEILHCYFPRMENQTENSSPNSFNMHTRVHLFERAYKMAVWAIESIFKLGENSN